MPKRIKTIPKRKKDKSIIYIAGTKDGFTIGVRADHYQGDIQVTFEELVQIRDLAIKKTKTRHLN